MGGRYELYTREHEPAGRDWAPGEERPEGLFTLWAWAVFRRRDGRILLAKRRADGLWEVPGGKVRFGESSGEAAARKAGEELGLAVKPLQGRMVKTVCLEEAGSLADIWLFEGEWSVKELALAGEKIAEARLVGPGQLERLKEQGVLHSLAGRVFFQLDGGYLARCGLDCRECPVYKATAAGDEAELERLAGQYSTPQCRLNRHNLRCGGCFSEEADRNKMCGGCAIRKCALGREKKGKPAANCGRCAEVPCALAEQLVPVGMKSRNTLNLIAGHLE